MDDSSSLESIRQVMSEGDLQTAEALLQGILKQEPDAPDVLQMMADLYLQARRFEDAIGILKKIRTLMPEKAKIYFELGNAHLAIGQLQESVQSFQRGLAIDPHHPQAHNNLGIAFKRQGALQKSANAFRAAIKIAPKLVLPHRNLGELSRICGDREQAMQHFETAVRLDPKDAESHNELGMTAASLARPEKAISHFRKALSLNETHREAANNLAILLSAAGNSDEAVNILRNVIEQDPEFATARINLGSILIELGRFKEAVEHLEAALRIKPDQVLALQQLGDLALADKYEFTKTQLAQMKQFLDSSSDRGDDYIAINFTYAGVLEKKNLFSDAFNIYEKANLLNHSASQKNGVLFEAKSYDEQIQHTVSFFNQAFFNRQQQKNIGNHSTLPIFVVGMPRSGTTLVEQIISSHPQASGAGELAAIEEISRQIAAVAESKRSYPECLGELSQRGSQLLGQRYLEKLARNQTLSQRIVDKTWYNFYFLGLIATLFPKARIIHCLRDPRDIAISCFFSNFNSVHWSWKIEDIISYYDAYCRLMEHWTGTLPLKMFSIRYEELIADQERISRDIINFCGLEWSDDCLRFYKNQRSVQTASRVQVRKPIYTKSVGRWKSFESELAKVPEWIARFKAT